MKVFKDQPIVLFTAAIPDNGLAEIIQTGPKGVVYNPGGSCNVYEFLNSNLFSKNLTVFNSKQSYTLDPAKIEKIALIFNQISSPETHKIALSKLEGLLKDISIPCLNLPQNIMRTSRDATYTLLKDINGLTIPKTIKLTPYSPDDIYEQIRASGLQFPVIFRKAGMHGGKNMTLLYSYNESEKFYPFALDGSDYYLIQYIDYKEDGLYKKYRLVVIDGEVFIRHLIYSDNWLIHSRSREYMKKNPDYREKERKVLQTFDETLKPKIQPVIKQIHSALELDYFGIDCTIDSHMHITCFEINANMNVMVNNQPEKDSIWEQKINIIKEALNKMIIEKVNAS